MVKTSTGQPARRKDVLDLLSVHRIAAFLCVLMALAALLGAWYVIGQVLPSLIVIYLIIYSPIILADQPLRAEAYRHHKRERARIRWRDRPVFLDGWQSEVLRMENAQRERQARARAHLATAASAVTRRQAALAELTAVLAWAAENGVSGEEPRNYKVLRKAEASMLTGDDVAATKMLGVARDNEADEPILGYAARRTLHGLSGS